MKASITEMANRHNVKMVMLYPKQSSLQRDMLKQCIAFYTLRYINSCGIFKGSFLALYFFQVQFMS